MRPALSVVVPHHGDPEPTSHLLDQLAAQVGAPSYELIVVDDHSPQPFPERAGVRVLRRATNGGFGATVNTGAAVASGELLLVLNSDVEVDAGFLRDLVDAARPWLPAVVSPRVVDPDGHEAWTARHFPTVGHQVVEWLTPLARWRDTRALHEAVGHDTRAHGSGSPTIVDFVVGAAMLLPLDSFREVGGFDEGFFMNSEEVDLQRRLRERGVPSVVLPAPVLTHEGGGSSAPGARRGWLVEGRVRYAAKWGHPRRLHVALVAATAANLAWNAGRRVAGRPVRPIEIAADELALIRAGRLRAARRSAG